MTVPPTVVVVDDSADLRLLVRTYLERSGRLDVVAEGGNGHDAVALAREHRPDVMLLDVSMPEMDGLEALPVVRAVSGATRVIMFTGFEQEGLSDRARQLGATALLQKSMAIDTLADHILTVAHSADDTTESEVPATSGVNGYVAPNVLDEHRERFREVFDEAAIGMGTMTLAGHLVRVNRAMAALIDRPAQSLVGSSYEELVSFQDRESFEALLQKVTVARGGVGQFEHGLARSRPGLRMRTTLAAVCDTVGDPLYLFAQFQDVSEQRAAEAALRQSEERFRLLVETVSDYAIFMLDPTGRIQSWNAGAQRMKGYAAAEMIGQHFRRFYPVELQRNRHPEHELELALRDGHYEEEGWRVRKDGSQFWANVVLTAVYDTHGAHIGFAKITRDITERRRMQDEKEAAAFALEQANDELGTVNRRLAEAAEDQAHFLAITAHELRTPITILAGTAEILRDDRMLPEPERDRMLTSMVANAARLRRLLDDLLTAAWLDAQAMVLDRRPVSLGPVLQQSVDAINRRLGSDAVSLALPSAEVVVLADDGRVGQIVDNLINNAVNHGRPPVQIMVTVDQVRAEIRVADSGAGVPAEVRDQLFDRYVTAARSGTGLGLYIVRELARAHQGDAWYEHRDRPTFIVNLPLAVPR